MYSTPSFRPSLKPRLVPKLHLRGFSKPRIMPRIMPAASMPRVPGARMAGVSTPRPSVKTALMSSQSSNGRPRKLAVHQNKLTSHNITAQKPGRGHSYSHMYQTQIKVRKATVGISGIQKPRVVKPRMVPLSVRSPFRSLAIK